MERYKRIKRFSKFTLITLGVFIMLFPILGGCKKHENRICNGILLDISGMIPLLERNAYEELIPVLVRHANQNRRGGVFVAFPIGQNVQDLATTSVSMTMNAVKYPNTSLHVKAKRDKKYDEEYANIAYEQFTTSITVKILNSKSDAQSEILESIRKFAERYPKSTYQVRRLYIISDMIQESNLVNMRSLLERGSSITDIASQMSKVFSLENFRNMEIFMRPLGSKYFIQHPDWRGKVQSTWEVFFSSSADYGIKFHYGELPATQ